MRGQRAMVGAAVLAAGIPLVITSSTTAAAAPAHPATSVSAAPLSEAGIR
jgi:hypothetical protein